MEHVEILVAQELKKIVGYGAEIHLTARHKNLARLSGVPEGMNPIPAGIIIRCFLDERTSTLQGPVEFGGRTLSTEVFRRAVRLLLKLEGTGQLAPNRRFRALEVMGLLSVFPPQEWRRLPELKLMLLVAEQLVAEQPSPNQLQNSIA